MNQPTTAQSLPEDEEMDPVGKPYPEQEKEPQQQPTPENGDDPPHPPFSPSNEPDIAPE